MTLIFSERLFYLDTNQESPILEQFERKVSFWDTLKYTKVEIRTTPVDKVQNKGT